MNIAQLSEQLKDVPQNRLVDYARNPNSVVPQFLALAEIQRRQHLQNTPQPPAATVAEDVLAQAAPQQMPPQMAPQQMVQQLPENQPGVAQLPTGMPQGMASGGIVAFAGGDLVDDEEEYDAEEKQANRDESRIRSLIAGMRARAGDAVAAVPRAIAAIPRAVQDIRAALPESYESAKAKTETGISTLQKKGAHPYESIALDEAKKFGLDENLVRHVLQKETGGLKDPSIARSKAGAYGPMQLMPGTAKDLGVDIMNPEQNTRGGVRYLAQMMDKFKDPTLALAAYNAGPGRVQQMLKRGLGIESLKPETQQYVKYADGGIVAFANRGLVEDDEYGTPYNPYAMMGDIGVSQPSYRGGMDMGVGQFLKRKLMGVRDVPEPMTVSQPSAKDFRDFDQAAALFEAEQRLKPTPSAYVPLESYDLGFGANKSQPDREIEQAGPKRLSYYEEAVARINQERENLKEQAKTDKYLAMLQASLGMMAGTSPYAMANIGQGGMQGVAAYAAAKKQRAAEASSLGKEELAVKRLEQLSESEKAALEVAAEDKRARAKLGQSKFEQEQSEFDRRRIEVARDDLKQYLALQDAQLKARFPMGEMDPNYAKARATMMASDPMVQQLQREAFPRQYNSPAASSASGTRPPLSSFNK
jgi:hypothetical protein